MNNKKTLLINVKKSNTEILWDEGDANVMCNNFYPPTIRTFSNHISLK